MIKFIRDNADIIIKFIKTHVVMSVLGLMVGLAVLAFEGDTEGFTVYALLGSVFTIGFMCFLHYDDMYFYAAKEGIRARNSGEQPNMLKGLWITLVAYSPVILVGIINIAVDILAGDVENASPIALLVYYAFQGTFLTLYRVREVLGLSVYIIVSLLPAIVSSVLGYLVGVKDKSIRGMIGLNVQPPYDGPLERKPKNKNPEE